MADWNLVRKVFLRGAESLIQRLPSNLDNKLIHDNKGASFWVQACPGFDSKIYVTKDIVSTSVDQDYCDLPCDFEAGVELTILFTFKYFESLLTEKSRLCRWLNKGVTSARVIEQWDGQYWMNTQGSPPSNSQSFERHFVYNNLILPSVKNENISNFSALFESERE